MDVFSTHKKYIFILLGFSVFIASFFLDPISKNKIDKYNPTNTTHYNLPYDSLPPSPYLFETAFLDSIKHFSPRDTVVLIGNSVIAGSGAKDKNFFNSRLGKDFNVINAGLNGEYLGASSALAVLGINASYKINPDGFYHIVVAYPPVRTYLAPSYWVTGLALSNLAIDNNLYDYVAPVSTSNPLQRALWFKSVLNSNMRCIDIKKSLTFIVDKFEFYCEKPFGTEQKSPIFLKTYNENVMATKLSESGHRSLSVFMENETFIHSESLRLDRINSLIKAMAPLENFLLKNKINFKIYFLLLRDAPTAIGTFTLKKHKEYISGKKDYLKNISELRPEWVVLELPEINNNFFFDEAHMREEGQAVVAEFIKNISLVGRKHLSTN